MSYRVLPRKSMSQNNFCNKMKVIGSNTISMQTSKQIFFLLFCTQFVYSWEMNINFIGVSLIFRIQCDISCYLNERINTCNAQQMERVLYKLLRKCQQICNAIIIDICNAIIIDRHRFLGQPGFFQNIF